VRLHILHHAAEQEIHDAWMTEEPASHSYQISPGASCPTPHRLEADGLRTSKPRFVDGRVRRVYRTTRAGGGRRPKVRNALEELAREILGS
jgi:DNA-binding PadR family transcriptional regulator